MSRPQSISHLPTASAPYPIEFAALRLLGPHNLPSSARLMPYSVSSMQRRSLHLIKGQIGVLASAADLFPFEEAAAIRRQSRLFAYQFSTLAAAPHSAPALGDPLQTLACIEGQISRLLERLQPFSHSPLPLCAQADYLRFLENFRSLSGGPDPDPAYLPEQVAFIRGTAGYIRSEHDRLRRFADLTQGEYHPQIRSVELASLVRGWADWQLIEPARQKGLAVRLDLDAGSGQSVLADPLLLEVAASNLFANALKYACRGIDVTLRVEGDRLRLLVQDDGVGMTPLEAAPAFTRGVKNANGIDSTGQGLADSLEVLQSIPGASIYLSWRQDPTLFVVELPLARD